MAADTPLSHLVLAASFVADYLGYVALADLAKAIGNDASDYRIIGGHMITVLAARWMLGADLYRETGDADLGVTPVPARSIHLPDKLKAVGYEQVAGNRFARTVADIPVTLTGVQGGPHQAIIDILVPAYTGRPDRTSRSAMTIVATEIPGPAAALGRPAVTMTLDLRLLTGEMLHAALPFPDEVSALVLKGLATRVSQGHRRDKHLAVPGNRTCRRGYAARLLPQRRSSGCHPGPYSSAATAREWPHSNRNSAYSARPRTSGSHEYAPSLSESSAPDEAGRGADRYSRKVPQPGWTRADESGCPGTVTCGYALRWMCCPVMACKRSGVRISVAPLRSRRSEAI